MIPLKINFDIPTLNEVWISCRDQYLTNTQNDCKKAFAKEQRNWWLYLFSLILFCSIAVTCLIFKQTWFVFPTIAFWFLWITGTKHLLTINERKFLKKSLETILKILETEESISGAHQYFEAMFKLLPLSFMLQYPLQFLSLSEMAKIVGQAASFLKIKEENIFKYEYDDEAEVLEVFYTYNNQSLSALFHCKKIEHSANFDSLTYENNTLIYNQMIQGE